MNIFTITKNISLNIFSFSGFLNIIFQVFVLKKIINIFSIAKVDFSAITGITFLLSINLSVATLLLIVFIIAIIIELLINKNAVLQINNKYRHNKIAKIYLYFGITGNFLPFILTFIILQFV